MRSSFYFFQSWFCHGNIFVRLYCAYVCTWVWLYLHDLCFQSIGTFCCMVQIVRNFHSVCTYVCAYVCLCILTDFISFYGTIPVRVRYKNYISKSYVYLYVHKWMSCGIKFLIFCQNHSNNFLKNIVQAFFQKKKWYLITHISIVTIRYGTIQ